LSAAKRRQKEIRYSSRTRAATDQFKKVQKLRGAAAKLLAQIPKDLRQTPEAELLASAADGKVYNIVHLIYRSRKYEGASKDYEFSRQTMEEHWKSGYHDTVHTLRHPEVLQGTRPRRSSCGIAPCGPRHCGDRYRARRRETSRCDCGR
jgi:NTE family protein